MLSRHERGICMCASMSGQGVAGPLAGRTAHHPGETVFKPAYARFRCPRVGWHDHSINNLMVQGASLKLALNRARRGERPIVQLSVIERSGSHLRPTGKRYMLSGTASSSSVAERSTVNRMVVGSTPTSRARRTPPVAGRGGFAVPLPAVSAGTGRRPRQSSVR